MTPLLKHPLSILTVLAVFTLVEMAASRPLFAQDGPSKKYRSVDHIQGVGKFKFGEALKDIPPQSIQPVAPTATGILLRVSPYGDNYLVKDLSGLTWGGIPLAGMVITFHEGKLIDFQVALKGKKADFYVADRAFKEKYGPSDPRTFPVETWKGNAVEVSLVLIGAGVLDENSLDAPAQAKVELFNASQWNQVEAAKKAKLKELLDKRYEAVSQKVKTDL